jgi:hydroxymethylpyrimidine/phosphomethylpyrimidine kinase
MKASEQRPVALTIAGSDSGGGAGIQADLKTFAALGVHGTCAITCVTAQHPRGVQAIEMVSPRLLEKQIAAVFDELPPVAVKTGMLFSAKNIAVVTDFFRSQAVVRPRGPAARSRKKVFLIVDPVMLATSGSRLLTPAAINRLLHDLLPLATLVTPNLSEAAVLGGQGIASIEDMRQSAKRIYARFGCAVLLKGGHLPEPSGAADIFFDGRNELMLLAPRIRGIQTHGTGCTYSAAITAALALGHELPGAVQVAKDFITAAIAGSYPVGAGHYALNPRPLAPGRFRPGHR